jgi:phosphoglucan,water dikinase
MERCLEAAPAVRREYLALAEQVAQTPADRLDALLECLRGLLRELPVPAEIADAVTAFFGPDARLAVRSSANGEDLEDLAGAGLYDSVVNVATAAAPAAIGRVWASLWTRRATLSRAQANIPHDRIRMAVLLQELVMPDLSFILHTVNPLTGDRGEALAELAVGLGEVLASATVPGEPYRLTCDRRTGATRLSACATFSVALRPSAEGGVMPELLDYSTIHLSTDPEASTRLGGRLGRVAAFLEGRLGRPQDVEGVCSGEDLFIVQARPQQGL